MSFPEAVEVDGFSIDRIDIGSAPSARGSIWLFGSNDKETWTLVGSSNSRKVGTGQRFLHGDTTLSEHMTLDFRPTWPLFADKAVKPAIAALGLLCTALCSSASLATGRWQFLGKLVFSNFSLLLALISLIAGVGYAGLGLARDSFVPLSQAVLYLAAWAALALAEARFPDALGALAACSLACEVVQDCALFADCDSIRAEPPWVQLAVFAAAAAFAVARLRFAWRAVAAVRADRARFEDAWRSAVATWLEPKAILDRLRHVERVAAVQCAAALPRARQLNRRRAAHIPQPSSGAEVGGIQVAVGWGRVAGVRAVRLWGRCFGWGATAESHAVDLNVHGEFGEGNTVPCSVDPSSPVASLDQLYSQAIGVAPILRRRCAQWAAVFGGTVAGAGASGADAVLADDDGSAPDAGVGGAAEAATPSASATVAAAAERRMSGACQWVPGLSDDEAFTQPAIRELLGQSLLKRPARAVEKALACYGGDVSRLLDVCRARIVFADGGALADCLDAICDGGGGGVRVVRVKNTMSDQINAASASGFRVGAAQTVIYRLRFAEGWQGSIPIWLSVLITGRLSGLGRKLRSHHTTPKSRI
jgi:hypothetical protein